MECTAGDLAEGVIGNKWSVLSSGPQRSQDKVDEVPLELAPLFQVLTAGQVGLTSIPCYVPYMCYNTVLYYTILYYTILYYTILYYTILY